MNEKLQFVEHRLNDIRFFCENAKPAHGEYNETFHREFSNFIQQWADDALAMIESSSTTAQ